MSFAPVSYTLGWTIIRDTATKKDEKTQKAEDSDTFSKVKLKHDG